MTPIAAIALLAAIAASGSLESDSTPLPSGRSPHSAAIHVHSTFSNGQRSVLEIARLAREQGVEVLVLTDSFMTRVTYGVWPFDRVGVSGLNRHVRPGVLDHGLGRYIEQISEASRQVPEVLIVPGVEVAPHYWWSGTPWGGLTLHGFDRHLWVVGLSADDMRHLPVVGNETVRNTRPRLGRIVLPAVLLAVGVGLLALKRERTIRLERFVARRQRRYRKSGLLVIAIAVLLAWNNWPFGDLSGSDSGNDIDAFQRVIDYVHERDGVSYWSYPEASYPDVHMGGARMRSAPHPDDLLLTDGYDGMEGLYGDDVRATIAGGPWDHALLEYVRGQRKRPPFVVTGIDFHGPQIPGDAWSRLDGGTTYLLLNERTESAVVDALRRGHAYATFMGLPEKLTLDSFVVKTADGNSGTHGDHIVGRSPVVVRLSLDWADRIPDPPPTFDLEIVLNGRVEARFRQTLPIDPTVDLELAPGRHYVRVQAEGGRLNRVLGNPVFIDVQ